MLGIRYFDAHKQRDEEHSGLTPVQEDKAIGPRPALHLPAAHVSVWRNSGEEHSQDSSHANYACDVTVLGCATSQMPKNRKGGRVAAALRSRKTTYDKYTVLKTIVKAKNEWKS